MRSWLQVQGVASSIPSRSHTFVEIDHEIISTVIFLPSSESFMKGCCQLQAKVCARLLVNCLFELAQEKSVVRWTDRPAMTVDLGRKATKQTNTLQTSDYDVIFDFCIDLASFRTSFKVQRHHDLIKAYAMRWTTFIRQHATMQLVWEVTDKSDFNFLPLRWEFNYKLKQHLLDFNMPLQVGTVHWVVAIQMISSYIDQKGKLRSWF